MAIVGTSDIMVLLSAFAIEASVFESEKVIKSLVISLTSTTGERALLPDWPKCDIYQSAATCNGH
jgi:hypothetical protein